MRTDVPELLRSRCVLPAGGAGISLFRIARPGATPGTDRASTQGMIARAHHHPTVALDGFIWVLLLFAGLAFALLAGCAAPRVELEETGAAGHRSEAAKEAAASEARRQQFDPYAVTTRSTEAAPEAGLPVMDEAVGANPTGYHLAEAARHDEHARAHAAAAETLEHFEAAECKMIAAPERSACPILVSVVAVRDIDRGVRIELPADAHVDRLANRMRCHLAYARAQGFANAPSCPLYMKGVDIRQSKDGRAIEVLGAERAVVSEIRKRVLQIALVAH